MITARPIANGALGVLSAYRADLSQRQGATMLGSDDGDWLTIGTILEHARTATAERRDELLEIVRTRLVHMIGAEAWRANTLLDTTPFDTDALGPRIRLFCEHIEDAGALGVANAVLAAYLGTDDDISPLERARCDALRARLAWGSGNLDIAFAYYEGVAKTARDLGSAELEVRSAIGFAILARMRGNYPESRNEAQRALVIAQDFGFPRLIALAHQSLVVAHAMAGKYDDALVHAWAAYQHVRGDAQAEAAHLVDLAQLFYEWGHLDAAAAGFEAVLSKPLPDRIFLPAVGGAALTAAHSGRRQLVHELAQTALDRVARTAVPYAAAIALTDVITACAAIGDARTAELARIAAIDLSELYGYHEIRHRAEHAPAGLIHRAAPSPLSNDSWEIEQSVRELVPVSHR